MDGAKTNDARPQWEFCWENFCFLYFVLFAFVRLVMSVFLGSLPPSLNPLPLPHLSPPPLLYPLLFITIFPLFFEVRLHRCHGRQPHYGGEAGLVPGSPFQQEPPAAAVASSWPAPSPPRTLQAAQTSPHIRSHPAGTTDSPLT